MKKTVLSVVLSLISLIIIGQDIPKFGEAIRLGDNINTASEEAKPVLNSDATIMYFVRAFHEENEGYEEHKENEDIWEAVKDENGNWKKAEHEVTINDEKNNSIIGQGVDDHFFLLNTYQDKRHLDYGIAQTRKLGEHNWTKPLVIKIPKLKYQGDFYDFYITHDEQILIISIQGEDSRGKEDLYVAKNIDGKWTDPINLGDKINTSGFEMSPFLTEDKKYLYYSTNGRNDGYGDADIYRTERLDDSWTNWSEPENLGNIVNSEKMDCYFTMADNEEYFFASNREGSKGLDIYQVTTVIPTVVYQFLVLNSKDSTKLDEFKFEIVDPKGMKLDLLDTSNLFAELIKSEEYNVHIERRGFSPLDKKVQISLSEKRDTLKSIYYLSPEPEIVEPTPPALVLKRVLHDFDQTTHSGSTGVNIDDVVAKMKENPWLKIRIESHTDNKGSDEYNMELSKNRATSAKTYLIRRGISGARIESKWYGESRPVAPNQNKDGSDNEEGRSQNRRTEFIITSERPN